MQDSGHSQDQSLPQSGGADAELREAFSRAADRLDLLPPLRVGDLPEELRAATRRLAAELRASNAEPEAMLRRIKLVIGSSRTPAHGEAERHLGAVVVSLAIRCYFGVDDRDEQHDLLNGRDFR